MLTHPSNHRERKERYIKTLEREVLRLRDEEAAIAQNSKDMREELDILRDLLVKHGIPVPTAKLAAINSNATVSVFELPSGGGQSLHVDMPSPNFFAQQADYTSLLSGTGFSGSDTTPTLEKQQPRLQSRESINLLKPPQANIHQESPEKALPALPPQAPNPAPRPVAHVQRGLDTAQIGIDFVLT
jgi:hypothetical protein